jgi:arabinan endo-1,5-alpha-L-arabinosidase
MGNYQFLHVTGEPGSTSRGYLSPGGVSFSRDATTGKYFMVFHTRFVGRGEQHEVRVHQMYINADGWPVIAPQRYAGETKSATDLGRIVGNYKLIKNLKAINATVNQSTVISLLADGTVTGASTGTWQLTGTNDLTLVLAGTTYRGVFARQWDDDTLVWVLDFTAIASDGVSVWGSKVAINTAPAILTDPASQSVLTGTSVTFTTMVSGDPAPAYQWKKNNVSIAGATNSSYPIANIALGDAGSYSVVATNSVNAATSTAATLTVTSATVAPAITTQPVSQTINEGSAVTFAAAASGDPTPTFQWKKNNATIGGATSSTYQILTVTAGDAGNYTVVATNSVGNATSNGATLTVIVAPTNAIISIAVQ